MSRSAARSQAKEPKGGPTAQASSPLSQKLEAENTVPGRLTRAQQADVLMSEDADEIVGELMDELLDRVLEGCYKAYVDRQLVGFCASWAKTYITQILQQQLLCVDPEELSKTEDPEPLPAVPDVWAHGCVAVIPPTPPPHSTLQQEDKEIEGLGIDHSLTAAAQTHSKRPVSIKDSKGFSPHTPAKTERMKKRQFAITPKPIPRKSLPSLSCATEDSSVPLEGRSTAHSVHNHRNGAFNHPKDQKPIPKLDLSALPGQYVLPLYEIVDTNCTRPKKPSGLSKLERTGPSGQPTEFQRRNEACVSLKDMSPSTQREEGIVSSESVRLDTMVLAKGVTLLDPKSAQWDPLRFYPHKQSTKLKPIRSVAAPPKFSADQITLGVLPRVTPLFEPKS